MNGKRGDPAYVPTKERILRAALKLFSVKGFKGTTMKDIARDAEITEGAIYRHFKSKEEIVEHLLEMVSGEIRDVVMNEVLPRTGTVEKAKAFAEAFLDYALEHPERFRFMIIYNILREEKTGRLPCEPLLEDFKKAYREGDLALLPEVAFSLVTGLVEKLFVLWELGIVKAPREILSEELKKALEKALLRRP